MRCYKLGGCIIIFLEFVYGDFHIIINEMFCCALLSRHERSQFKFLQKGRENFLFCHATYTQAGGRMASLFAAKTFIPYSKAANVLAIEGLPV